MMKKNLTYAVVGTGGIGGYYGGRLAEMGHEVHFLFHSDYEEAKRNGLKVKSVKGDFHIKEVKAYESTAAMPKVDVVLVCLKTTSNHLLCELLPPLMHDETVVILVQNGLGIESELSEMLPQAKIAGATAFICSSKIGPATVEHAQYGELTVAPFGDCPTDVLKQVCEDFAASNVPAYFSDNLDLIRWRKLVWNIPYNGLSVVMHASTDELMECKDSRELIVALMTDVVRGAKACGVEIRETYIQKMLDFTDAMTPYLPSMRLDYDAGRRMEIRTMYENPVETAARNGYEMATTRAVMQQLSFMEWKEKR